MSSPLPTPPRFPSDSTLSDLVGTQAKLRPRSIAVEAADGRLSYQALDRRAEALARQLRTSGVKEGDFVGLSSSRSTGLIVGMLGILKAGAAYVPLDAEYPLARRTLIVEDAALRVLVVEEGLSVSGYSPDVVVLRIPTVTARRPLPPIRERLRATDPAYLIYTSGSTGKPKGVVVTHANVVGLLNSLSSIVPVGPGDVVSMAHSFAFDVSVYEVWSCLTAGARLWIPTADWLRTPNVFHDRLHQAGVTILSQTPTAFRMLQLAEARDSPPPKLTRLKTVLFAGERLEFRALAPWISRYGTERPRLLNLLGPTETTVHATIYQLSPSDANETRSIIGTPLPGNAAQVVDEDLLPVADGCEGELALSGWGVSKGYLNRPELTAERFRVLPAEDDQSVLWYLTGDRAKRLPDGRLEFLGRADGQVKLRGHRIELGEIEAHLRQVPGIQDAVVVLEDAGEVEAHLVALYIPREAALSANVIADYLAARLPEVMRPGIFMPVTSFPRTVNGKLDRLALRQLGVTQSNPVAVSDAVARDVAAICARLLRRDAFDARSSFFEAGGHSLLAARLFVEIESRWGVALTFADLLRMPSPLELSERIRASVAARQSEASMTMTNAAAWITMDGIVDAQVRETPHAVAVADSVRSLTYQELSDEASRWAFRLRRMGAIEGSRVAVSLPRSVDLVVATLAILKCGAVFVPIDPMQPTERRRALLADADATVWIHRGTDSELAGSTTAQPLDVEHERDALMAERADAVALTPSADRVAYLLYTSGTTGTPNSVELTHHTLVALLTNLPRPSVAGTVLQWAAAGFDVSLQEAYYAFSHGARLLIADEAVRRDPEALWQLLLDEDVSDLFLPNTPLQWLMEVAENRSAPLAALRRVYQAGEPLVVTRAVRAFFARHPLCTLINHYGPTETHVALVHVLTGDPAQWPTRPPIGRPVGRLRADLIDPITGVLTEADEGELVLTGVSVGLGYRNRPEKTQARFSLVDGVRRYRTGDRVRRMGNNEFAFVGRVDREVKIRGYRVNLGDVEDELCSHPSVRHVAVREHAPVDHERVLVAYLVINGMTNTTIAELDRHLRDRLPAPVVPTQLIPLPRWPVTPNGKLDEGALPSPSAKLLEPVADTERPCTPDERVVAAAFSTVLGRPNIGTRTHFFEAGGHSLGAVRLTGEIYRLTQRRLSPSDVFDAPTVEGLAQRLAVCPIQDDVTHAAPIPFASAPMSPAQTGMWILDQTLADPQTYLVVEAFRVTGPLDLTRLRHSFERLMDRHPVLRTVYREEGGAPTQRVDLTLQPEWTYRDLTDVEPIASTGSIHAALEPLLAQTVDLSRGPISRVYVLRVATDQHLLLFSTHHVAVDGWSISIIWRDWGALYQANTQHTLPPLRSSYLDYAREQQLGSVRSGQSLAYWRTRLAHLPTLELPTDRPRPARASHRGRSLRKELDPPMVRNIRALLTELRCTVHNVLMASFYRLLSIASGQTDFGLAFIASGRDDPRWHDVVGMFAGSLILRVDLSRAESFAELVGETQKATVEALAHGDCPFDQVVAALAPPRSLARQPFTDVMYAAQDIEQPMTEFADMGACSYPIPFRTAKTDLLLMVTDHGETVELWWEYSTDLFDAASIDRFDRQFRAILSAGIRNPSAPMTAADAIDEDEQRTLRQLGMGPVTDPPSVSMVALLSEQALKTPEATAVVCGSDHLTYAQLDQKANQLARVLIQKGVARGSAVGVMLSRDVELIVALLGIWKAGAAYVPVDPQWPPSRREQVLVDAGCDLLLWSGSPGADTSLTIRLLDLTALSDDIALASTDAPEVVGSCEDPAYILFTSGSTGRPKAVLTPHRAIVRLLWRPAYVHLDDATVIPFLSALTFDAATFEIWAPLLHGGQLVVSHLAGQSLMELAGLVAERRINTMWLTSAYFNLVIDECPAALAPLRQLLIGGEALSPHHLRLGLERLPRTQLINGYGPTETTTFACAYPIPRDGNLPDGPIPIGRPIQDTRLVVVNDRLEPLPLGAAGELLIAGPGVALGYRGHAELTAERFLQLPLGHPTSECFYRSGDRVRWDSDGQLAYLGRLDRQLKIRGHRIEPGEIEAALLRLPGIRQAAVGALNSSDGMSLLAGVVPATEHAAEVTGDSLRKLLRAELPSYMIPDQIVVMATLPRTTHGKLELQSVLKESNDPSPADASLGSGTVGVLCGIASELLNGRRVEPQADFFAIGGHSLLAVRLLSRIRDHFGKTITLASFLHEPSMQALARMLDGEVHPEGMCRIMNLPGLGSFSLSLRLVRTAKSTPEGVLVGMPGVLGHAAEISFAAQHILPTFDVYTFSLDAGDRFSLDNDGLSLRDERLFLPVLESVVTVLSSVGSVMPTALFGFSLGGVFAWRVEQALRHKGFSRIPILNFDGTVDDLSPGLGLESSIVPSDQVLEITDMSPPVMLLVHRDAAGSRQLQVETLESQWRKQGLDLSCLPVPTLDHLEVAVSAAIAPYADDVLEFIRTGSLSSAPGSKLPLFLDTRGGRVYALLAGHRDRDLLRTLLADDLADDGMVRLGLLEATLLAGETEWALQYAQRIFAVEPQQRAAANVIIGVSEALGDFDTARRIKSEWIYGEPLPVGLKLSPRTAPIPSPSPAGPLVIGYRPSLFAAAADLRFPTLAIAHLEQRVLKGWAFDPHSPGEPVILELLEGETTVMTFTADQEIPTGSPGSPDGLHGFAVTYHPDDPVEPTRPLRLRARADGSLFDVKVGKDRR